MKAAQKAIQLINELPESKIKIAIDFLEFLNFRRNCDLEDLSESVKTGLNQVALHKKGKLKTKNFEDLLDEL